MVYTPSRETWLLEAAYRRLGTRSPACFCGERHPLCMTGKYPRIICYECLLIARGFSPIEDQHPLGQYNSKEYVIPMPGNPHRVWDAWKTSWPEQTLLNPEQSPLVVAAAAVRSYIDFLESQLDRLIGWVPSLLETIDAALTEAFGSHWWEKLNMKR